MTRIGFAYNQKPEQATTPVTTEGEALHPDEEPPSTRRDDRSRAPDVMAAVRAPAARGVASPAASLANDDEFAEWDTPETIDAVAAALGAVGEVVRLEADPYFPERLREARPDIVFNIAEGRYGTNREAHVPAICEFYDIAYSGSDPFTLSLCLDKAKTKEYLALHGVPTAPFTLVRAMDEVRELADRLRRGRKAVRRRAIERPLSLPLFVKPVHEGSSKGITERNFVRTPDELEAQVAFLLESYAQPVLVEEYLPGAEFTCAVLGNGEGARVLPIIGMNFEALPDGAVPIYGYEAKWLWDRPEHPLDIFACPARVPAALQRAIENVTLRAYHVLNCRDWSRIDVRLDAAGEPNVVEVNPLPGILPNPADNSCFPKAARAAGLSYDELIQSCLFHAAERQGVALPGVPARVAAAARA
jgi:D-alanine-D-alanine ligase